METIEAIKKRRSIREYQDRLIPKEALEQIIDAARFAATARDIQPWEFVVITDKEVLKKIAAFAENGRFLAGAQACIAVFCSETKYYLEDGCAATENMLIAATDLGIGSCWVAGDKKPYCAQVNQLLKAPEGLRLVSLISLGYPKSNGALNLKEKRGLEELLHWEVF
jgi:nitroreductase